MSTLDALIEGWDEGHREFAIALNGCPDEDLWKRPHPRLLSVGELAGHVAYWQAVWVTDGSAELPDLEQLPIKSPLLNHGFRYYTSSVDAAVQLPLTNAEVIAEVARVHQAVKDSLAGREKDERHAHWGTLGNLIQYQVFHVAYHTGQAYSVRHLLGHETEDN
jgi:uncharacterized damage-inducible protein DinB